MTTLVRFEPTAKALLLAILAIPTGWIALVAPYRQTLHESLSRHGSELASAARALVGSPPALAPCVLVVPLAMNLHDRGAALPPWLPPLLRRAAEVGPAVRRAVDDLDRALPTA